MIVLADPRLIKFSLVPHETKISEAPQAPEVKKKKTCFRTYDQSKGHVIKVNNLPLRGGSPTDMITPSCFLNESSDKGVN